MALLLIELDKRIGNAAAWRETFAEQLPDLEVRIWPDPGELADIEYVAFMHPDFDALPIFPNLKAMFSRSAARCSTGPYAKPKSWRKHTGICRAVSARYQAGICQPVPAPENSSAAMRRAALPTARLSDPIISAK